MSKQICMKFSGKIGNAPMNKWLNFGGDPDQDLDSYHDTGKRWLGGDMHCPSASSYGRPMGRPLYFHPVVSIFFFFTSPNLSHRGLDVCHTSTHGVALVPI